MVVSFGIHGKSVMIGEPERHFLPWPVGFSPCDHNILCPVVACVRQSCSRTALPIPSIATMTQQIRVDDMCPQFAAVASDGFVHDIVSVLFQSKCRDMPGSASVEVAVFKTTGVQRGENEGNYHNPTRL